MTNSIASLPPGSTFTCGSCGCIVSSDYHDEHFIVIHRQAEIFKAIRESQAARDAADT